MVENIVNTLFPTHLPRKEGIEKEEIVEIPFLSEEELMQAASYLQNKKALG